MDGLNYLDSFFNPKGYHWNSDLAKIKIEKFVKAFSNSKYTLIVFIDAYFKTDEAILKWKSRREKELLNEEK